MSGNKDLNTTIDDTLYPMARFRPEFDQLGDRFWGDWSGLTDWNGMKTGWNLDWQDKGHEYVLSAELPGCEPNEIDMRVSGNVMTVRAQHREESDSKSGSSYRYGHYSQTFTLPNGVLADAMDRLSAIGRFDQLHERHDVRSAQKRS